MYQVTTLECSCIIQAVNMSVTTLDFEKFIAGTPQERKQFAEDLLSSFERTGFAKMTNHTFSTAQLQQLFHWVCKHIHEYFYSRYCHASSNRDFQLARDNHFLTRALRLRMRFQMKSDQGLCVATRLGEWKKSANCTMMRISVSSLIQK